MYIIRYLLCIQIEESICTSIKTLNLIIRYVNLGILNK